MANTDTEVNSGVRHALWTQFVGKSPLQEAQTLLTRSGAAAQHRPRVTATPWREAVMRRLKSPSWCRLHGPTGTSRVPVAASDLTMMEIPYR
jgi:hypothetical protein